MMQQKAVCVIDFADFLKWVRLMCDVPSALVEVARNVDARHPGPSRR